MTKTVGDFYNDEVTRLRDKQNTADEITRSNERLAAMNDSYRKRYAKYVQILMVLVLAFAIYLAVVLLQKQFPMIPQFVVDLIMIVLIFLVAFYLFNAGWELYSRSLINYDEVDLPVYDASGADLVELAKKGQVFAGVNGNVCVGKECCPNFYDVQTNTCNLSSFSKSGFTTIEDMNNTVPFDSPLLQRKPNAENVKPIQPDIAFSTF